MKATPAVGSYAVETTSNRVGQVVGHDGGYVQLRPIGGGREWDCFPDTVRQATQAERLHVTNAYANARSRGEVP